MLRKLDQTIHAESEELSLGVIKPTWCLPFYPKPYILNVV